MRLPECQVCVVVQSQNVAVKAWKKATMRKPLVEKRNVNLAMHSGSSALERSFACSLVEEWKHQQGLAYTGHEQLTDCVNGQLF